LALAADGNRRRGSADRADRSAPDAAGAAAHIHCRSAAPLFRRGSGPA
jgi:hypothetical protein